MLSLSDGYDREGGLILLSLYQVSGWESGINTNPFLPHHGTRQVEAFPLSMMRLNRSMVSDSCRPRLFTGAQFLGSLEVVIRQTFRSMAASSNESL